MSSYKIHEPFGIMSMLVFIAILQFYKVNFNIIQLVGSWNFAVLYLSDLDANYSRSLSRIGILKCLFAPFHHRGILHDPRLWSLICIIAMMEGYNWIGIGILGASLSHITLDNLYGVLNGSHRSKKTQIGT